MKTENIKSLIGFLITFTLVAPQSAKAETKYPQYQKCLEMLRDSYEESNGGIYARADKGKQQVFLHIYLR